MVYVAHSSATYRRIINVLENDLLFFEPDCADVIDSADCQSMADSGMCASYFEYYLGRNCAFTCGYCIDGSGPGMRKQLQGTGFELMFLTSQLMLLMDHGQNGPLWRERAWTS